MASKTSGPQIFDDASRGPARSSVFRSIMSKQHKRQQSADVARNPQQSPRLPPQQSPRLPQQLPHQLPPQQSSINQNEHAPFPWTQQPAPEPGHLPLSEIVPNRDFWGNDGLASEPGPKPGKGALHKKTKSSVSLKSLKSYMERKDPRSEDVPRRGSDEIKPKKTKSTASLSAILKRSQRGHKGDGQKDGQKLSRDKENRSPIDLVDGMPSPIWPQGTNPLYVPPMHQPHQSSTASTAGHRRSVAEELELYTPKGYSPAQQRNFCDYQQPSLSKTGEGKHRPKSEYVQSSRNLNAMTLNIPRNSFDDRVAVDRVSVASPRESMFERAKNMPLPPSPTKSAGPPSPTKSVGSPSPMKENQHSPKKISRVQAAISVFNAKEKDLDVKKHLDSKDLENEFEKLLDARNIPHNMRDKMRSLDTNIKADFIQKDRIENGTPHSANGSDSSRRGRGNESKDDRPQDRKISRSHSRNHGFTLRGSASPGKKPRPESGGSFHRPRSVDLSQPVGVYTTLHPGGSVASFSDVAAVDTAADPSDFVHYLREIQKPEMVEVGKLHKLRLLLRNETVSWVNGFITEGGMDEIVQLIYRIMKMEWREDHEDTLLHEALLCLKGLCTTSIALAQLASIEGEIFPALLKMLFDEEKKGPSEFTTRGIIINLLFTQLADGSPSEMPAQRAKRILSYLRDPSPTEGKQPVAFIADIYQSRPYRVWCKEVTNVTKEVFWIFLHHLNVIPLPKKNYQSDDTFVEIRGGSYAQRHFPLPRPPVPAAPYVGGVEWDATNYLAAHLDLMSGLISLLPTVEERNQLRADLRASGFEKVMGATLRTCKEKFYSSVHECLRTWVAAAAEDGWTYVYVREGPSRSSEPGSPTKSPKKAPGSPKKGLVDEKPPQLNLGFGFDFSENYNPTGPETPSSDLRSWL
ncbi:hypothetical protein N7495_004419 [Penicillium taxi]|uniref:uncharacterized protein n=1 Tax=Penicillium taxi TaxID=168475 RepID=UPI0025457677|nr:uncharacterized protein N7495_004419 [Penicillium taxi]KAJ5899675.1 hypothetical protein N7495_004419 [Penicillium taxi]